MNTTLKIGETFSGCKILSLCGKGSFGVTYLAENPIGQNIIIKVVSLDSRSERELNGLRNYMQISGSHPGLLKVSHIGELPGAFYYTMEAADDLNPGGEYLPATLGNMLRQKRIFSPDDAVGVLRELLEGVRTMHEANLIHRDIKPDNIIFVNGKAKLSDPGLVIEAGDNPTFAGTPGFVPPEMIEKPLLPDRSCDLYALGKVFYCMVTGLSPREYPTLPKDMPLNLCRQLFPLLCKMCDHNPKRRFQTAEAFLSGLPLQFDPPSFLDRLYSEFRNWKILNPVLFKVFAGSVCAGILLSLCASGAFYLQRQKREEVITSLQKKVNDFLSINKDRKELVAFQLKTAVPQYLGQYLTLDRELHLAVKNGHWKNAASVAEKLQTLLRTAAEKIRPVLKKTQGSFQQDFDLSGKAHSFLATPLASYLGKDLASYKKRLAKHDGKLFVNWHGPRTGRSWENFQYHYCPMAFVPGGAVVMQHSKKTVRIPYHFWICKNEAVHEHFTRLMGIAPQRSPHANTPVERVSWNDVLCYCYFVTRNLRSEGVLPPGYIVRPPTEAEWEYAAKNAWLGKDDTPFENRSVIRTNSQNRTWPPGTKLPNKLGVFDMYGNVSEIVLPVEKTKMHHSVVIRGGSYLNTQKTCLRRIEYLKYQFIPYDIGFRVVVGPGDMDYFDKHFFLSGPAQKRRNGKVYELIGANIGAFTWERAEKLCRLLGGRLAQISDRPLFDFIVKNFPLAAGGWGCFVGGKKIQGKWTWTHCGKKIDFGKWIRPRTGTTGEYLMLKNRRWMAVKDQKSSIFLCEWDEKEYHLRNRQLDEGKKLPFVRARFSIGSREYLLIESAMLFYTAVRVCELLGGRLAVLDTPQLRKEVIHHLEPFKASRILLGGYAKREKWFFLNGKEIDFPLLKRQNGLSESVNRNFLVLQNGKFYNSQCSSLFLCERRKSSISLN